MNRRIGPFAIARDFASFSSVICRSSSGRPVESVDLYLAHFLGAGGATRFLRAHDANPDGAAADLMPGAARANRWVFYDQNGAPRSFAEIRERFAAKLGGESGPLPSRPPAGQDFMSVRMAALGSPTSVAPLPSSKRSRPDRPENRPMMSSHSAE